MSDKKIGIGIVTYNAPERIRKSAFTVPSNVDEFVIVNDGTSHLYDSTCYPKIAEIINHPRNLTVACAKNNAIRNLIQKGCDYVFIMEDDIMIKNENVFDSYIEASVNSNIHHLLYGYHGPANIKNDGSNEPNPRLIVEYPNNTMISLNPHCVGAFCLYTKQSIKRVGYMREDFKNAFEHVEHSYRYVRAGLLPAYWWWPDIANSNDFLKEIASSTESTTIPHTDEWKMNYTRSFNTFKSLHGFTPVEVPDSQQNIVLENLKNIKKIKI